MSDGIAAYKASAGLSLLFCSRAEILAAPAEEREAYYRIVGGLPDRIDINALDEADPVHFRSLRKLTDDEFDDNQFSIENGDGSIY